MQEYIHSLVAMDNGVRHMLKLQHITPVVSADKVDVGSITERRDGLILNKTGCGIQGPSISDSPSWKKNCCSQTRC